MHIIRTAAYQGHAVPQRAGYARGPFNPEILADPVIITEDPTPEPYNATAQNNYQGERMYVCRECGDVVPESGIDTHVCPKGLDGP